MSTSHPRALGAVILYWDMFFLDVSHVSQDKKILADPMSQNKSLIISEYFGTSCISLES